MAASVKSPRLFQLTIFMKLTDGLLLALDPGSEFITKLLQVVRQCTRRLCIRAVASPRPRVPCHLGSLQS